VRLLDVASGKYRNLTGHTRYVKSVVFDPRGELLTSTSADGTMRLWRVDDRSDTERSVVVGAEDFETLDVSHQFVRPAWSPDGERLAVPAVSCIKVFRRGAWALPLKLAAHDADPSLLAWSPDGRYMASAGLDMKVGCLMKGGRWWWCVCVLCAGGVPRWVPSAATTCNVGAVWLWWWLACFVCVGDLT